MQEEKNTQEDSKHTGKFRALSVVLVVAVALFVSSPISAFAEKFPTLPGVGTGSGSDNSWMENNPLLPGNNRTVTGVQTCALPIFLEVVRTQAQVKIQVIPKRMIRLIFQRILPNG